MWGLVNNAGMGIYGDVEYVPVREFKRCAEINVYGMIRVTQACLPLIRKTKGITVTISI